MFKTLKLIAALCCLGVAFIMFIFDTFKAFTWPPNEEEMREENKFFLDMLLLAALGLLLLLF